MTVRTRERCSSLLRADRTLTRISSEVCAYFSNLLPVMSANQNCLSAHAELRFGDSSVLHRSSTTPARKTCARGFRRHSSGRNLRRGRFRSINTPGLRACRYKTAPGRSNWPNRDPIGEEGGRNLYVFAYNTPVSAFDPDGRFSLILLPQLMHLAKCAAMEALIESFLTSPQEIRAWRQFVGGTRWDINLSEEEMESILGLAGNFHQQIERLARECRRGFEWQNRRTTIEDTIGEAWLLAIGRATVNLKTSCHCRILSWEACISDRYDFDPQWWNSQRTPIAEWETRLVWAAQVAGGCGWKEFNHVGCAYGAAY
jgi:hypothetical protein